jgi:hypothetical protein
MPGTADPLLTKMGTKQRQTSDTKARQLPMAGIQSKETDQGAKPKALPEQRVAMLSPKSITKSGRAT